MIDTTMLYAALLGLLSLCIALRVGLLRSKKGISVGDNGDPEMLVAMRRHANFVEYVPLILVIFALIEAHGIPKITIHVLGCILIASRIAHYFGLKADRLKNPLRIAGTAGTVLTLLIACLISLQIYFL